MNDRFNFRIWNKQENKYLDGIFAVAHSGRLIIDLDILQSYDNLDDYIIEQCTGLKDKNGNLIYEGDVIDYFGEPATIVWDCCGFKIKTNDDICHEFYRNGIEIINNVHKTGIEIIGNIHEQAEQKDK